MRLFVALEIPAASRAALGELTARLRPHAGKNVRWSDPRGIHLTLKFIGEVEPERLDGIRRALAGVHASAEVDAAFRGVGWFPNARQPRVFWAGVETGEAMAALAAEIDAALAPLGIAREDRKFRPHLTLARIKSPENLDSLKKEAERFGTSEFGSAAYSDFDLMESKLRPTGAEYTCLARFAFAPHAGTSGAAA